MGRKIPAKKHRGVKDPLVQQAKRLASLKGKINAPPKDPDEQPVPKSLTRLFAFRDPDKRKSIIKKKSHHSRRQLQSNDYSASGAVPNPLSSLRKLPGESGRGFSLRINSAVKALHNPAEELHYPLDIEVEDEKGLRMDEQRERRARKRRRAAQATQRGPAAGPGDAPPAQPAQPALTRTQKLALKKKAKKLKASEFYYKYRSQTVRRRRRTASGARWCTSAWRSATSRTRRPRCTSSTRGALRGRGSGSCCSAACWRVGARGARSGSGASACAWPPWPPTARSRRPSTKTNKLCNIYI